MNDAREAEERAKARFIRYVRRTYLKRYGHPTMVSDSLLLACVGEQYPVRNRYERLYDATWAYYLGELKPNYPVPATMDNAVTALFHQKEITVWSVEWFKRELRKNI